MVVTERRGWADWDAHLALLDASTADLYRWAGIDATARGAGLGRGILEEGETGSGLTPRKKGAKAVPLTRRGGKSSPASPCRHRVVRAFNALYWRRSAGAGKGTLVKPINDFFFFPLDKIHDWNRL